MSAQEDSGEESDEYGEATRAQDPFKAGQHHNWHLVESLLNEQLDMRTFRQVIEVVEEFIRLDSYLNSEITLYEREQALHFSTQQQIIDYINKSLKGKLYNLSQLSALFAISKVKFNKLLANHKPPLQPTHLIYINSLFDEIERDFVNLFELIKSK